MSVIPPDISDSDSSDDEEIVDELMDTLFGSNDLGKKSNRISLEAKLILDNFNVSENGHCNYRDATVLKKHTAVVLPPSFKNATRVKLSVHLNHEFEPSDATTVSAPAFVRKHLKASSQQMARKWPLKKNEMWLVPSELGPTLRIDLKKRNWELSRGFRKVCDALWPKFILLAEAHMADGSQEQIVSEEFEVRSKEQSNKSRAARGLATQSKRRRTPEIESRTVRLRAARADIIQLREEIGAELSRQTDSQTKLNFMIELLKTRSEPRAAALLKRCQQHAFKMARWKHN